MEWKHGECWKLQFFKNKLWVLLVIWVKWKQSVCSRILLHSNTLYTLFVPFFVQGIYKFKCDNFLSDILLQYPNLNDSNNCVELKTYFKCLPSHDLKYWVEFSQIYLMYKYPKPGITWPFESFYTWWRPDWIWNVMLKTVHLGTIK